MDPFREYLLKERGLKPSTAIAYARWADRFLSWPFAADRVCVRRLTGRDLTAFIQHRAAQTSQAELCHLVAPLRALGRFHHYSGRLARDLSTTIPAVLKVHPGVHRVNGRLVLLAADGLKKSKAGRKMPAVKSLPQASDSNIKPEYILGHTCQALALLVKAGPGFQALPLSARIHEGLVFSNRDRRTLLDKLLILLAALQLPEPVLLVAAAYYACGKIIGGLLDGGGHLVSRLKKNACA